MFTIGPKPKWFSLGTSFLAEDLRALLMPGLTEGWQTEDNGETVTVL